jgi:hypothetical protein
LFEVFLKQVDTAVMEEGGDEEEVSGNESP